MTRPRAEELDKAEELEEFERALREPRVRDLDPALDERDERALDEPERSLQTHPDDERASVFAIMGGSTRKGSWEPAAHTEAIAIMGGVNLDFREADLLEGTSTVRCFAMMGGISIIVPPDVDVDVDGIGLLGGFDHVDHRSGEPDAPCIKVEGIALMGGVSVRVKKRKKPAA